MKEENVWGRAVVYIWVGVPRMLVMQVPTVVMSGKAWKEEEELWQVVFT